MNRPEIAPLTGIRAFAALAVVAYNHRRFVSSLPGMPESFGASGYLGVDVFFVLSGLVLSLNYAGQIRSVGDYLGFVGNRIARLYPLHLFTLAAVLGAAHLAMRGGLTLHHPENYQVDHHLVLHLLMVHSWGFEDGLRYNLPSWSISTEFFAYLLFPAFWFVASRPRTPWAAALAALAASGATVGLLHNLGHTDLHVVTQHTLVRVSGSFLAGCLVYRALQLRSAPPGSPLGYSLVVAGVAALALSPWADPLVVFAAPALLYVLARGRGPGVALFAAAPVVWLGRISYSIYLTHLPIGSLLTRIFPPEARTGLSTLESAAIVALDAALVVAVAALCFYVVELPGRRWIRALFGARPSPQVPDAAAR